MKIGDTRVGERLFNWKFDSALRYAQEDRYHTDVLELIEDFSRAFGNSGWFEGTTGTVVSCAVNYLLSLDPEQPNPEDDDV